MRKSYAILSGIFLIALAFRFATAKYDYLLGADPWSIYKTAEDARWEGNFQSILSYYIYPYEAYVKMPAGLTYLPVYAYKLVGFTGISFYKTFQLLPAIFGAMATVPLYLLVRELHSEKAALLSALLLAITPAGIERALAGFYRGDVFMLFTMLFAFYFFVYSVKRNLYASPLAGIFLFLCAFVWDGWPFAFATLSLAFMFGVIADYYQGKESQRLILSYIIAGAVGLSLTYLFKQSFYAYSWNDAVWKGFESEIYLVSLSFALASLLAVLHFITKFTRWHGSTRTLVPVLFFLAGMAALYSSGYLLKFAEFIKSYGAWSSSFIPATMETQNIAELQEPSLDYIYSRFISLVVLAPVGAVLLLRKKLDFNRAFSLAFTLSSFYVLTAATRFSFLSSPAVCLLGALSILYILEVEWQRVMAAFVTLLLLANASASIGFTADYKPLVYDELFEALEWLGDETPEASIVLTWWSYSGPVYAVADRRTIFGTYPSLERMKEVSKMFITGDDEKALSIAKTLSADYILVDKYIYDLLPNYMFYTDEPLDPWNSTLFKMYRGKEMKNFTLAFENDRVKIYEPLYSYTRIQEVRTERRFYETGKKVTITAEILTNENASATLRVQILDPNEEQVFSREYDVAGNSTVNAAFTIPSNSALGTYLIAASLYGEKRNRIAVMYRTFVVNKHGKSSTIINAQAKYDPFSNTLAISGSAVEKDAPLINEKLGIWGMDKSWEVTTNENGEFELVIENPDISMRNSAFYVYTLDRDGFVIVFANVNAELVEDLRLSKHMVKRGEEVEITYAVKNNADFPFEGYLTIDDVNLENSSMRMRLFTEYPKLPYRVEPGEKVSFKHRFSVSQDIPADKYRIWRAMRDENLKIWVEALNEKGEGYEAEINVVP